MARRQFDLIVFDWDGTLADSTAHIARSIQLACDDLGLPTPDQNTARHVIGLGLHEALQIVAPALDCDDYPRLADRYRYHYLTQDKEISLFAGVRDMLIELREAGYLLAVATGKSRAGLNHVFAQISIAHLFDSTRCADETFSKPHPAMLLELAEELGSDIERTLMIGDTTHDLQMATNAGASSIAVTYGAHPAAALLALEPGFAADSVTALMEWLREYA